MSTNHPSSCARETLRVGLLVGVMVFVTAWYEVLLGILPVLTEPTDHPSRLLVLEAFQERPYIIPYLHYSKP